MYRVQLQDFEGPLDLLLFFIRRDELDIHDIPIAQITDEYLAYVRTMEELDLDGVGDFIYMAAILIGIKAKMLLPRPELDEEGEPVDPRAELVQRLLEYVRYREAADHLEAKHDERGRHFTRGAASAPEVPEREPTYRTTVFDLIGALRRVLAEAPPEATIHPVRRYAFTMEEQQDWLLARLADGSRHAFAELVHERPRGFVVVTFLAVLDLAQRHAVRLIDGTTPDDFRVMAGDRPLVRPSLSKAVAETAASDGAQETASPRRRDRPPRRLPTPDASDA